MILPKFMLKRWAVNGGRLVRFYRPHREVKAVKLAPAGAGYREHLYTLDGYPPEQRAALERDYMGPVVDDPGARAAEVLLARDASALTPEVRNAWVRFL